MDYTKLKLKYMFTLDRIFYYEICLGGQHAIYVTFDPASEDPMQAFKQITTIRYLVAEDKMKSYVKRTS
jgi:hypothetical protein